jgi:hypothetical protein
LFADGRALLAGRDDAKFHSTSSAAAAGAGAVCGAGPPTRSSSDEEAGGVCAGAWKGLDDCLGLAETSDANGSMGGGVAVDGAGGARMGVGD